MSYVVETTFLHYLFAIAWADGVLDEREEVFLTRLVASINLDEEGAARVNQWFEAPPAQEANWEALDMNYALKEGLMRRALLLSGADKVIQIEEMTLLERLRGRLGFNDEAYSRLIQEVEDVWKQEA